MARTIRIFHVTTPLSVNSADTITARLFLPARTGHKTFETMTQTMSRIQAWLRVTGMFYEFDKILFSKIQVLLRITSRITVEYNGIHRNLHLSLDTQGI